VAGQGNAPFYVYWADGNETNKQRIMFSKIWQTSDLENAGSGRRLKMVNLAGTYDWTFTDMINDNSTGTAETIFNMSGTPNAAGNPNSPKPKIVFTNHLVSSTDGTELKFDVDISGFNDDWWDQSATGLVMAYKIESLNATESVNGTDSPRNVSMKGVSIYLSVCVCVCVCVYCVCALACILEHVYEGR
jgi:hypothetical protein